MAEGTRSGGGRGTLATVVLLAWIAVACAMFVITAPPPEPPAVDPQEQAIRERMANWAVEDAEDWQAESGDLLVPWAESQGQLAIVIDDVGRELDSFEKLLALRFPLSFSILPGSSYASGAQDRLLSDHRRPREILLHLPMEPLDPAHMRDGAEAREDFLLASDGTQQLQAKLRAALEVVPHAVGVNNHMGSKLTREPEAMAAIMPVLRERGLYFLDSRTTPETVAADQAARAKVPTLSRQVFLDHEPGREAIRRALWQAAEQAQSTPTVAIAHPSQDLVEVLREELPRLHAKKIGIYPVSRVLREQAR